jgi:hypothetical protein
MAYAEDDIRAAAQAIALREEQIDGLVAVLRARHAGTPSPAASIARPKRTRFDLVHLLWYGGALIVMGAMGLFTTLAFEALGGMALAVIAVIYAVLFTVAGHFLWHRHNLQVPGGLLIAVAVAMVPLAIYGIQDAYDVWDDTQHFRDFHVWIRSGFVPMEIGTVMAGLIALRFYRFPFIVAIMALALWYLSMDLALWLLDSYDPEAGSDWQARRQITMVFGLVMLGIAWAVDLARQREQDFAFWLYLAGLLAFWGAMSLSDSSSELAKALYCVINVGLVLASVFLMRRAFAVFGAIGITLYLGYLAYKVFEDSLFFPFALSAVGIAIIGLGLLLHRKRPALSAWMSASLPPALKKLRPIHTKTSELEHA